MANDSHYRFANPVYAFKHARRSILNNALRRRQQSLNLSGYGLTELPAEIGLLSDLKRLDISNNRLSVLPSQIGNMAELAELSANNNKITTIPAEIGNLQKLSKFTISDNKLSQLPDEIGHLKSLISFTARENNIESLPKTIGHLTNLTFLDLRTNRLSDIPSEIKNCPIRTLTLMDNNISEFPEAALEIEKLVWLDLDNNKISIIPKIFSQTKIRHLYLNSNQLSEFPPSLLELQQLQSLMLSDNSISTIPDSIGQLRELSLLTLSSNRLKSLPSEIGQLKKLRTLDLENNELTQIPDSLGQLLELEEGARQTVSRSGLLLQGNPLIDPLRLLARLEQPEATVRILAWLRGDLDPRHIPSSSEPEASSVKAPPEPSVEAGPSFKVSNGKLDLNSTPETQDFDRDVQSSLHRRLKRQVARLKDLTARVGNQHPQLAATIDEYASLIEPDLFELDIVDLWAVGNALMAQANSFERHDRARTITEPLEPDHLALLNETAAIHGGFILGFPRAAELVSRADHSRAGLDIARSIEAPTSNLLGALSRQHQLLSERARQLIEAVDAALIPGSWGVARIGYTSYATTRNALVVIGRLAIWINDKGGSLAGGTVIAAAIETAKIPPEALQMITAFLQHNAADILSFAAPFPELRNYLCWIIDYFDGMQNNEDEKSI